MTTPHTQTRAGKTTIVALVENKPGVLNRVVSLFRRRAFNVDSLTVGRTHKAHVSRMTIVVDSTSMSPYKIKSNLEKLVNVISVQVLNEEVPHVSRERLPIGVPVHVTMRVDRSVGTLRRRVGYRAVRWALGLAVERRVGSFRIVHVSIQRDHLPLIVEARDRVALTRGMQGFGTSCARTLNGALGRRGRVFSDRYHAGQLATPRQVRHALSYVLNLSKVPTLSQVQLVRHEAKGNAVSFAISAAWSRQ
jgi:acetolactate synthase small subunit